MQIYISKNGQQLGPYTAHDLDALLQSEEITGDDLYWYEGCAAWTPLSQFPGFLPPPASVPPPPPQQISASQQPPPVSAALRKPVSAIQIGVVGLGVLLGIGYMVRQTISTPNATDVTSNSSNGAAPLELISWNWGAKGDFVTINGEVKNASQEKFENLQAIVSFYGSNGELITTKDAFTKYTPLLPGQTSPFATMVNYNPAMRKAGIEFHKYLGGKVAAKYTAPAMLSAGEMGGVVVGGSNISSIEDAQRYVIGVWTDADHPADDAWTRWVVTPDGSIAMFEALATADNWGAPKTAYYQMATGKYDDTGKRFYAVQLKNSYKAIITEDGRLKMGQSNLYLVKGERFPFSK